MEAVAEAILVLILLASPQEAELADRLAKELREQGGAQVTVLVGKEAEAKLQESGIGSKDLLASPVIGAQLTKFQKQTVLLYLQQREVRGDIDLDCQIWFEGRRERVGGIAGDGGDVYPFLRRGVMDLLGHRLNHQEAQALRSVDVATLVQRKAWPQVLAALAEKQELSVKDHYYKVLAYSRIGQRDPAVEAFAAMREAYGQHFLVAAAQSELPAEHSKEETEDWGGNTLIDTTDEPEEPAAPGKTASEPAAAESQPASDTVTAPE